MSAMAFNWGEDIKDEAGDKEPALEMGAIKARRLGVRRGTLPERLSEPAE